MVGRVGKQRYLVQVVFGLTMCTFPFANNRRACLGRLAATIEAYELPLKKEGHQKINARLSRGGMSGWTVRRLEKVRPEM